jgi:putative endonuclease
VSSHGKLLGAAGEMTAEQHLRKLGYTILHRNLRLGRIGELDLVAQHNQVIVFVEVKTKLAGEVLGGFANITAAKQRKLRELGQAYIQYHAAGGLAARFDAIEVEFLSAADPNPLVRHLPDAFR